MSGSKIASVHFHLCFISIPAPKEGLQMVRPKFGRCIFTSVLSAFQLPKRICSEWLQDRFPSFSLLLYRHSSSLRGSAVSESNIASHHFHFCFISIPAPREDLQMVRPNLGRACFTSVLSAFQLYKFIFD